MGNRAPLSVLLVALAFAQSLSAEEFVAKMEEIACWPDSARLSGWRNQSCSPVNSNPADHMATRLFRVYTTAEVDGRIDGAVSAGVSGLNGRVQAQLQGVEARLRGDLIKGLDAIPPRVLSEQVAKELKAAVLQELRDEMARTRRELQDQIDKLKARPPAAE